MKLLYYIGFILFLISCGESSGESQTSEQSGNEPIFNLAKWNTSETKVDLDRRTMKYDSIDNRNLTIQFTWSPKNVNTEKSILDSTYSADYLHKRITILEIQDVSKISLNMDYKIPGDNIEVESIFFGLFSNFESYKNLKGLVRFEELTDFKTKFKIMLSGELNEMIEFKHDTILNEEIRILN